MWPSDWDLAAGAAAADRVRDCAGRVRLTYTCRPAIPVPGVYSVHGTPPAREWPLSPRRSGPGLDGSRSVRPDSADRSRLRVI